MIRDKVRMIRNRQLRLHDSSFIGFLEGRWELFRPQVDDAL